MSAAKAVQIQLAAAVCQQAVALSPSGGFSVATTLKRLAPVGSPSLSMTGLARPSHAAIIAITVHPCHS